MIEAIDSIEDRVVDGIVRDVIAWAASCYLLNQPSGKVAVERRVEGLLREPLSQRCVAVTDDRAFESQDPIARLPA